MTGAPQGTAPTAITEESVDADRWRMARQLHELTIALTGAADLRGLLALRTGTALHWAYTDPQRLLDDVELAYVGPLDRMEQLTTRAVLTEEFHLQAEKHGWQLREDSNVGLAQGTFLRPDAPDRPLRIAVHFFECVPLEDRRTRPMKGPGSLRPGLGGPAPPPSVEVPGPHETLALLAQNAVLRRRPRDLYDVGTALERGQIFDGPSTRPFLLFYLGTLAKDFRKAGGVPESPPTPEAIAGDLHPFMPIGLWPAIGSRIQRALAYLGGLLQVTADEAAYLDGLAVGRFQPELLFGADLPPRIREHPAASRRTWFTGKEAFTPKADG